MIKKILKNATIYTVEGADWEHHPVQAMAVTEDGKIRAVGSEAEILKLAEDVTEIIDLEGRTVLPGFIDSHTHVPGKSLTELFQIDLFGIADKRKTIQAICSFLESHTDLEEYFGAGFNMGMVGEQNEAPCAAWLDEICSDKPIMLRSYDLHSIWFNTKAIQLCNIPKQTETPAGSRIHKDSEGNPTGLFTDCQSISFLQERYTDEQCKQAAEHYLRTMNAWGYTAINSIAPHQHLSPAIYREIQKTDKLTAHIATSLLIRHDNPEESLEKLKTLRDMINNEEIRVVTAKYLIDGVVEGNTAYLKEPYDEAAGLGKNYNAYPEWTCEKLEESFEAVLNAGFSIHCHSIGDASTSMVLDALETAQDRAERRDEGFRSTITHLQLVDSEDIPRMKALGVIAAIQPFWHFKEPGFYSTVEIPALGEERAEREYPAKSFTDAGIIITASGDFPVSPENNPFYGIKAGVIRNIYCNDKFDESITDPDDERFLLGKEERLTVPQLIEAYTINGAYQMFRENEIGSLSPGKCADYIVLDRNPLTIDVMDLDQVTVLQTVLNGNTVFRY